MVKVLGTILHSKWVKGFSLDESQAISEKLFNVGLEVSGKILRQVFTGRWMDFPLYGYGGNYAKRVLR